MERMWSKAYSYALKTAKRVRQRLTFIVGFNVNIDAVKHVNEGDVKRVFNFASPSEVIRKIESPPMEINSLEDFLAGFLLCVRNGLGEEWIIRDAAISHRLKELLGWDSTRMGGQGGNMSNIIAGMGHLAIPNAPSLPQQQADLFHDKNVLIPTLANGEVRFKPPSKAVRSRDEPLIHWIFEFGEGFRVKLGELEVKAPRENRFIATFDDINTRLEIAPGFWEGSMLKVEEASACVVAGYHLLQEVYSDGTTYKEHIERTVSLIKDWKSVNPELTVHAEMGFTASVKVRKGILNLLFPHVDSVGLNESELLQFSFPSRSVDWNSSSYSAPEIYLKARSLMSKYSLKRVFIHTREFSMSLLDDNYKVSPRSELLSLLLGASLAATLAVTGSTPTIEEAERLMKSEALKLSGKGLEEHQKLAVFLESEEGVNGELLLKRGFVEGKPNLVFIPSKLASKLKGTVGLGDSICAGSLVGEHIFEKRE